MTLDKIVQPSRGEWPVLLVACLVSTMFGCAAAGAHPGAQSVMKDDQRDLEAVRVTVGSVAHHIDSKRWTDLRSLYAGDVETDYTSLFGGTPQRQTGDALIAGWRGVLEKVATQHLLGPIEAHIAGSTARARCHVRALHLARGAPGGEQWEVLGHYLFDLSREESGWKITRMTLEMLLQTGNAKLLSEASAIRD